MDAELKERILECLRGLEIGESISADGIADEIGEKLSDVYDSIEILEEARLVELHPAYRKGNDPTYTLTTKGKRHMQPEIKERPEPEPAKEENDAPELRPSADRMCRFCGKVMEPNKLRRHENCCGKNPDRPCTPLKFLKKAEPKEEAVEVPAPAEYVEDIPVPTAIAVFEHEVDAEPEIQEVLEQLNAEDPDVPDELPPLEEVPVFDKKAERIVGRIEDSMDRFLERVQAQDALVLKGSPGMDAALRLIAFCKKMAESRAQVSVDATVQVSEGFHIHVDLCVPSPKEESDE